MPFQKVLIANRGEIAVRIIRACRELGISSVAVYSEADRRSLHVRMADEAVLVGPPAAASSYLSVERILEAARQSGADAIHPGYGFLSENAGFARAVSQAGLTFIGPPAEAIAAMGDKAEARQRAEAAGAPVVPGYQGPDDDASLERAAAELGFPLLVKAAAGGGGKGMRVVWEAGELTGAVQAARREAGHAFGDERLLLERYIPTAHHVEIQVLGDQHGNLLHLFERECSVQRRHQKIIEETPSPLLDAEMRQRMGDAAVAAARAVGYHNAGTVEFIVDPQTRQFYFLEMNTRLQVEHPVTELVTGLDLVHWQMRIAAGEALPYRQEELVQRGHAIECRLYAEDPAGGFLPATGPLLRLVLPRGPGVRVDSGFTSGDEVTLHYDPLLAKIIVHAQDRPTALHRMQTALRELVVLGVTTNWQFLEDVLAHPDFKAGRAHTTWVEQTFAGWQPPQCLLPPEVLVAAALTQYEPQGQSDGPVGGGDGGHGRDRFSPWGLSSTFRIGDER
jgi:3-methylcrotonyl-CoA carboxylase alpha subunit